MDSLNDLPDSDALDVNPHADWPVSAERIVERIELHMTEIVRLLGYNPKDQHFLHTPRRYAQVLSEFVKNGSEEDARDLLEVGFDETHDSLVLVGPIRMVSLCAHHMLPVTGDAWVGYIPDGRVCGLSKLARLVHHFAHQATVQERVTQQVVEALDSYLQPLGSICVIQAQHGCMSLRGVREPGALTVTSAVRGVFLEDAGAKAEAMSFITKR